MIDGKDTAHNSHTAPALSLHSAEKPKSCSMSKIMHFALLSVQMLDFSGLSMVAVFPLSLSYFIAML